MIKKIKFYIMSNFLKYVKYGLLSLAKNIIFCVLLMWFSILLVFSTIMQKEMSIESVHSNYIFSNIIWVSDFFPIFGGKIILFLIFSSLLIKLMTEKIFLKKLGTLLIHFGILILLIGGVITNFFSKEGFIKLETKEILDSFFIKNKFKVNMMNLEENINFPAEKGLYKTENFNVKIISVYNNTDLFLKKFPLNLDQKNNIINFFNVKEIPMFVERENNIATVIMHIYNDKEKLYFYLINETKINFDNKVYLISLLEMTEKLPFSIKLIKAEKINYFNSKEVKAYKSKILIKDKNIEWLYDIEMNKPLRYKNYTFYQTSFIENNLENEIILTISKDSGKYFPYVAFLIVFLGFLLHVLKFLKFRKL